MHPNKRDRTQVETLSGMGATEEFIASHLSLSIEELRKHYNTELIHGQEEANLQVAKTLHEMATSGEHPAATIAWLRMRAGWTDTPLPTTEEDDSNEDEAREKLLTLLNRAAK
jgi:hypothetical protein